MTLSVHLLGRPAIRGGTTYRFRSNKSWALFAYLLLTERPPPRSRVASLLFSEADDPLRALRWGLSEIRRGMDEVGVAGDPIELALPATCEVDVAVVLRGEWPEAVRLPGLGAELLEGMAFRDAAAFESWLLAERRHVAAASEAVLHEAALASLARGDHRRAVDHAVAVVGMNPLDENHQALLIRAYRAGDDPEAARRQHAACIELFERELGIAPGPAVRAAMRESVRAAEARDDPVTVAALVEAGVSAVAAGAIDSGLDSLRTAAGLADGADLSRLRVSARLALAETLIHTVRGEDVEGSAILHDVLEIASTAGEAGLGGEARAELGYVDFLRANYDRAEHWLTVALEDAAEGTELAAMAHTYLGAAHSDRGRYEEALSSLHAGLETARQAGAPRRVAYAEAMLGRVHLLRCDLDDARRHLTASLDSAQRSGWLAFLPWPQALLGEVDLAEGDPAAATDGLEQAFARACQLGDPCWEGASARGLALAAAAAGDVAEAFDVLADARARCNRFSDPYVWLDVYILDALCELGLRHGHPDAAGWVESMQETAIRCGMRELIVRSLLHGAAAGNPGDLEAARALVPDVDNPALHQLAGV